MHFEKSLGMGICSKSLIFINISSMPPKTYPLKSISHRIFSFSLLKRKSIKITRNMEQMYVFTLYLWSINKKSSSRIALTP